jgi:hypothetical protein
MGFLDHSTNNIILDAVLTDTGREFLARNDGSFSIDQFALGDDEVNYNIIRKYGRAVGKEKIEKNTPIFEAITQQNQSQKHLLFSISNTNLSKLPKLDFNSTSATMSGDLDIWTTPSLGKKTQASLNLSQNIKNESVIPSELRDQAFKIEVPNLFLTLAGNISPNYIDRSQRAHYVITKTSINQAGGSILDFTINAKNISSTLFDVYGSGDGKSTIKTYVRVTGMNSGTVNDIAVNIKRPGTE